MEIHAVQSRDRNLRYGGWEINDHESLCFASALLTNASHFQGTLFSRTEKPRAMAQSYCTTSSKSNI